MQKKSELEQILSVGLSGTPELKREEKMRYLGFFRERIVEAVTFRQLGCEAAKNALLKAIHDPRSAELVVHQRVSSLVMPYLLVARKKGVDFTIAANPKFIGDVAVLIAAREAVDVPTLFSEQ